MVEQQEMSIFGKAFTNLRTWSDVPSTDATLPTVGYLASKEAWEDLCCGDYVRLDRNPEILTGCRKIADLVSSMTIYLMENKGIVLTRNQLLGRIWGYDFDGETRTVDVHVRTLRQKLGEAGNMIETVRGVGYRIGE